MSKHVWIRIGLRQEPLTHIGPRLRLGTDIISRALYEGRYESRRALTYNYYYILWILLTTHCI